jgi:hypothetical protein
VAEKKITPKAPSGKGTKSAKKEPATKVTKKRSARRSARRGA